MILNALIFFLVLKTCTSICVENSAWISRLKILRLSFGGPIDIRSTSTYGMYCTRLTCGIVYTYVLVLVDDSSQLRYY